MVNKRFLQTADRWKNPSLPDARTRRVVEPVGQNPFVEGINYADLPSESFIMSYNGEHGDYFQELIAKVNEVYTGTRAEISSGKKGEVKNMYSVKRMALVSTIANNENLRNSGFYPITPMQSESLLKAGKLADPRKYWEDLALLLYDTNGTNPMEAQALKDSLLQHRGDFGLSQSDLENRLVIVNAGGEVDSSMPHGVKPIVIPGVTMIYPHEILDRTDENHQFDYGLDRGLPFIAQIGNGGRKLYMPAEKTNIGLRVLFRDRVLVLDTRDWNLAISVENGRVNFAPQGRAP